MNVNEINLAGTAAALNKEAVQLKTLPIDYHCKSKSV
jgi:hypothetical protein